MLIAGVTDKRNIEIFFTFEDLTMLRQDPLLPLSGRLVEDFFPHSKYNLAFSFDEDKSKQRAKLEREEDKIVIYASQRFYWQLERLNKGSVRADFNGGHSVGLYNEFRLGPGDRLLLERFKVLLDKK
jgi:hypothetical protein